MTTLFGFHEVEDGQHWANSFKDGTGSRREMFASLGITVRTFRDPETPNICGLLMDVWLEQLHTHISLDGSAEQE